MATSTVDEVEDKFFSVWQKRQIQALLLGVLVELGIYFLLVMLNGFSYTNHLLRQNLIPVAFFATMLLALAPLYRKTDDHVQKIVKQLTWTGFILEAVSIPTWIYYQFNPPTNGLERIVGTLTYVFFTAGVIKVLLSLAMSRRANTEPQ